MNAKFPLVEIGVLEDNGTIIEIQDGNHGERHPKVGDFVEAGIPFIMANDLSNGFVALDSCSRISEDQARRLRIGFSINDDVLLTHKGTLCNVALVTEADPFIMLTPQVTYYRTDSSRLLNRFLVYAFREPGFRARMHSVGAQGTRPYISITAQRRLQIVFPPRDIQDRIADILAAYDNLIENNRRRMVLLEEVARQLFREWFVRLRFPGHEHGSIDNGVPEGWQKATAFSATEVLSGGTPKTAVADYWDGEIPFYTPKDASDTSYVRQTERAITELGLKNCNSRLYDANTVFISARGTVGKLNLASRPMAMSQSCYALLGRGYVSQLFLFCALKEAIEHFKQHAVGAVFDAIVVDTFKLIPFMVPEEKKVRLFEEAVAPIFGQIANLMEQNEKLRAARDLLLPRLMSGEIPV